MSKWSFRYVENICWMQRNVNGSLVRRGSQYLPKAKLSCFIFRKVGADGAWSVWLAMPPVRSALYLFARGRRYVIVQRAMTSSCDSMHCSRARSSARAHSTIPIVSCSTLGRGH